MPLTNQGIARGDIDRRLALGLDDSASENLHQIGLHYWHQYDLLSELIADALGVTTTRMPSVGIVDSPMEVVYSFGFPRTGSYQSRGIDIKRSLIFGTGDTPEKGKHFIEQTGVLGSYLESSIFEQTIQNWQGTGLSTMQVMLDANAQGIPIYQIDAGNIDEVLPLLQINDQDIIRDIRNAVNASLVATIPERQPDKPIGAQGMGYILQDPITGAASYRIASGADGGEGEGPCAVPEPVPLVDAIRDIINTRILLAMIALLVVTGVVIVLGGPVVAAMMAALGLAALTFPATAGGVCDALPVPRKGRPQGFQSGLCADQVIGTDVRFRGLDVCVNGVSFDAITGSTLWEVKVINFSNSPEFIVNSQVDKDFEQRNRQLNALSICPSYSLGWAVADGKHFSTQILRGFDSAVDIHRQVPECFLLPRN